MHTLEAARKYEKEYEVDADKRPLFHVTPPIGWMNDPNGFSVYKGQIHLFYQYHPYSNVWGPMHWGHQVSEDMISWKQYPTALAPDMEYDEEGCFSGSAVMTNLGHVLFYTGVSKDKNGGCNLQNQCMAVGDGVGYKKLKNNPVLTGAVMPEGFSHIDFRDPRYGKKMVFTIC
ncbi:glycoside hydrolase family 32 protein [Clostridium sp. AM46-21]|uniref:glycoside hydrolase family 32 protein n=1 Tax=Clostridium sp. AM46-21 TaxID=2293033 RepID=UPI0015F85B58|nr:glycoside hydrolase family 32 protein [Clostridium sp. AM46-21]